LLASAACIGAGVIAVRLAYDEGAEPVPMQAVRFTGGGTVFAVLLAVLLVRRRGRVPWAGLGLGAAAGLVLYVGARAEFEGLARLPAAVLVLLIFMAPIWVALAERVIWRRRAGRLTIVAVALVVGGVALMVGLPGSLDAAGVAFGIVASITFAAFFVIMDRSRAYAPTALTLSAALTFGALAALAQSPGALEQSLGDPDVAPFAVAIAVSLWGWGLFAMLGLGLVTPTTAAIVSAAEPVFVALLALLLLDEGLGANQIAGGAVVMAGVLTVAYGTN
jgi:drug/metabolite transporter (DMT)-like permease